MLCLETLNDDLVLHKILCDYCNAPLGSGGSENLAMDVARKNPRLIVVGKNLRVFCNIQCEAWFVKEVEKL